MTDSYKPTLTIFTMSNKSDFILYEKVLDKCIKIMSDFSPKKLHLISNSREEYSKFITSGSIPLETDFVLVVQVDGFILNPSAWDNKFFEFDYIGAPWPHLENRTGNGGFSLRSKKLNDALKDIFLNIPEENYKSENLYQEDVYICINKRKILEEKYGIKFAPFEIASKFSVEDRNYTNQFGFHGKYVFNRLNKNLLKEYFLD